MCGIIAVTGTRPAAPLLVEGLRRLSYRGYDSSGIATVHPVDGALEHRRSRGKIEGLQQLLGRAPVEGHTGIGHTRWATHGPATAHNAHPHQAGPLTVVHNGILENHAALRATLDDEPYRSETDTEVIARFLAAEVEAGSSLPAAYRALRERAEGSFALAVLHEATPDEVFFARHRSPLLLARGPQGYALASDETAMPSGVETIVLLEDGDYGVVTPTSVAVFDAAGRPVQRPEEAWVDPGAEAVLEAHDHHMHQEIYEQPHVLQTLASSTELVPHGLVERIGRARRVVITACGSSYYAGLVAKPLLEQAARVPVEVALASEFRYADPILDEETVVIGVSQSGETADTLSALQLALERGAPIAALCNAPRSAIARLCDRSAGTVWLRAGVERSVASTKAFTAQVFTFARLAEAVAKQRVPDAVPESLRVDVDDVVDGLRTVFRAEEELRAVAQDLVGAAAVLFLGRGLLHPIALEGALKLKEISYLPSEGFAAGELKHGPLALVEEGTPVFAVLGNTESDHKARANLAEVRARGGRTFVVGIDVGQASEADGGLALSTSTMLGTALAANAALQLVAYHTACAAGFDVDQPRNLAKSVTVE